MRIIMVIGLICLLNSFGSIAQAGVVPGGPCVTGSLDQYAALGLTGCQVAIGGYNLTVTLQGLDRGTDFGTYPSDLSPIWLDPTFTMLPGGGYQQRMEVSLAPGSWSGVAGQQLFFLISLGITLDRPVTSVSNTVTAQNGTITAEICTGGEYLFGVTCILGTEYLATVNGTSASVSLGANNPITTYGVQAGFAGVLPDGQFSGITSVADVGAAPEPAGLSLTVLGGLLLARVRRSRKVPPPANQKMNLSANCI